MGEQRIIVAHDEHEVVNVSLDRQFEPFALAVTDHAVYVLELSRRSFTRNYHVQRFPLEQVVRVVVQRTRFGVKMFWAAAMVILGGTLTILMTSTFVDGDGRGSVMLLPIALILGGLVLPFTSRGHRTLRVEFAGRKPYIWKPSWFMADVTKQHVAYLIEKIVKAFRGLRIYVHEDDG